MSAMKVVHAAALMEVGWYVMTPPLDSSSPATPTIMPGAPLSKWGMLDTYDTAADCRKALIRNQLEAAATRSDSKVLEIVVTLEAQGAKCVASDDPRLKEK